MTHYFLALFFPTVMAILQPKYKPWNNSIIWSLVWILYTLFIGFRYEVGADWLNYWYMFYHIAYYMNYNDAFHHGDPAFWLLQVWVKDMGWDVYIVNLIGAGIFMLGVIKFLRQLPNPWLGMVIVISYTGVAVVMGYVRQGIAVGIIFWALAVLNRGYFVRFLLLVAFAAAFHKSAVIVAGMGLFQHGKNKYLKALAGLFILIGMYSAFISGKEAHYVNEYIKTGRSSSGALIRIAMNLIAALFFLYFRKIWKKIYPSSYQIWYMMALGSIGSLFVVWFASTAVDRIALYFIPLQVVVWTRMPILMQNIISYRLATNLVILYYATVYFVFLNFARWSFAWLPYKNVLLIWFGVQHY